MYLNRHLLRLWMCYKHRGTHTHMIMKKKVSIFASLIAWTFPSPFQSHPNSFPLFNTYKLLQIISYGNNWPFVDFDGLLVCTQLDLEVNLVKWFIPFVLVSVVLINFSFFVILRMAELMEITDIKNMCRYVSHTVRMWMREFLCVRWITYGFV